MLHQIIKNKTCQWLQSEKCAVRGLLVHIREKGALRDTQIEAIETYLFLKIAGENKPLHQLFSEGFFNQGIDFKPYCVPHPEATVFLQENPAAYALFDFASRKLADGKERLPHLVKAILANPRELDYDTVIRRLFYNVSYPDYLMSLPMGAGKTFLMAAFIYLDLYFSSNEPDNPNFARNFLVMIPSGLKTSIGPSLRTIETFDPSWVIPSPAAEQLKRKIQFEVLDEQKSGKKSNKARNPNSQKVAGCLPDPLGRIFVVNAEKVILNTVRDDELDLEFTEGEEEKNANELRLLIGKIPHLSILIDEVHHAAKDDIRLRQVVTGWNRTGNITGVLGFSGTPYLSSAEKIPVSDSETLKIAEITNTVYYYPLTTAIEKFLKTPTVKIADNLSPVQIVKAGIEDFNQVYGTVTYDDGTVPKVAVYCSSIEILEEEIYPYLQNELKLPASEILRFHGGNKNYSLPKENQLEFRSLDTPASRKRYILLVAIGKEGWDCRSLTAVILPQKSKSTSKNSIIQTTCRCLRQVTKGHDETALVWLNRENAAILNKQLEKEQRTSVEELNRLTRFQEEPAVERFSRMDILNLPAIDYYQLKINYQAIETENSADTGEKLAGLIADIAKYKNTAIITSATDLAHLDAGEKDFLEHTGNTVANFNAWVFTIYKDGLGTVTLENLHAFDRQLRRIFQAVTFMGNDIRLFDGQYDMYAVESAIRLAFSRKSHLQTDEEVVPKEASLLIVDQLISVAPGKTLFPDGDTVRQIRQFDATPRTAEEFNQWKTERILQLTQAGQFEDVARIASENIHPLTEKRNKTFHFLPYKFDSGFENSLLNEALTLKSFNDNKLEIYFNGERGLTEFVIRCYAKKGEYWRNVGKYTTDFLIIQRTEDTQSIHKALIIETKGEGYADDRAFLKKKAFVETAFLQQNESKFGYRKFEFLYLEDSVDLQENLARLNQKINTFFSAPEPVKN